jgi:hypothetical protein
MSHLTFQDTDIIEVLSNDYLSNHSATWFDSLDVSLMTDESKSIFSNFIIMNNMLTELRKRANLDDKTVDS